MEEVPLRGVFPYKKLKVPSETTELPTSVRESLGRGRVPFTRRRSLGRGRVPYARKRSLGGGQVPSVSQRSLTKFEFPYFCESSLARNLRPLKFHMSKSTTPPYSSYLRAYIRTRRPVVGNCRTRLDKLSHQYF